MEIGWLMPPNSTHKKCQPAGVRPKEAPPHSSTFRSEQRTAAAPEHEDEIIIIKIRKLSEGCGGVHQKRNKMEAPLGVHIKFKLAQSELALRHSSSRGG